MLEVIRVWYLDWIFWVFLWSFLSVIFLLVSLVFIDCCCEFIFICVGCVFLYSCWVFIWDLLWKFLDGWSKYFVFFIFNILCDEFIGGSDVDFDWFLYFYLFNVCFIFGGKLVLIVELFFVNLIFMLFFRWSFIWVFWIFFMYSF